MVTRVNGFSGMDIDSMVKSMMAAKRVPLDKLNQQKQILNWTRDSYREINSKLVDFRTNKLTDKYGVNSAMNANKAVTTGNTDALTATATATATGITMKVSITQLATKTTLESKGAGANLSTSSTLADAMAQSVATTNGTTTVAAITDADKAQKYSILINGETFSFTGATGISTVISTINASTKANASASFDEVTGKLSISSKTSGSKGALPLGTLTSSDGKNLMEAFNGIKQYSGADVKTGVDAIMFVNNTKVVKDSNNFILNGIQMNLLSTTSTQSDPNVNPSSDPTDKPITISTQSDPQTAVDTIKGFVEDYNSLIATLNSKISEEKYRDYAPLTDEQKADMKEADITAWTAKAQSGLLKNDDILKQTITSLRSVISDKLGALSSIGVTTGAYYEGGKLIIDEATLKKAVTSDAQGVMDLFQGPASTPSTGIFDRMATKIGASLDNLVSRVGTNKYSTDLTISYKTESVMGKKLTEYNTRISTMQTMLDNAETRYYKQFTAMETAMNKLQSQSSNLFSTGS